MYSIGEISKLVKISVDTLRYYDEIDLLKPVHTDPDTRYRYYSEEQVNSILAILEFKQLGFSLDAIKELLNCSDSLRLKAALNTRYEQLLKEAQHIESAKRLIKERMNVIEERDNIMMDKKTVLLVDDSDFLRMMLKDVLEKHGYAIVAEAINGIEAIAKHAEFKPDLTIMDIQMPEVDGIEALKGIKAASPEARVLMCSAKGFVPKILQSIKYGALDFVVKPFMPNIIAEAVGGALEAEYSFKLEAIDNRLAKVTKEEEENLLTQEMVNELIAECR